MTRASNSDLKKHWMASLGDSTIGSPDKLNEVFKIIGTPVRR